MQRATHTFWTLFLLLSLLQTARPCFHDDPSVPPFDPTEVIAANHAARHERRTTNPKIALDNVRVFNGQRILPPSTIIIDGSIIGTDAKGAKHIDGRGQILLPGLIDTHCHPMSVDDLRQLSSYGITTGFVQATVSQPLRASLVNHDGLTDLRFASRPAAVANASSAVPPFQAQDYVGSPAIASAFVANQTSSDWIKILALTPGYSTITQPIINALTSASRRISKFTVIHASFYDNVRQGLVAAATQIHHSPTDRAVDAALVKLYLAGGQLNCPTLTAMLAKTYANPTKGFNFSAASESVTTLYRAGVPILAGTDANLTPGVPFRVPFGDSMLLELQLLVKAGLSPLDALRAATVLPARYYGLNDRGKVEPGLRADLLLVGCDPTGDMGCVKKIQRIWIAGMEHEVNRTTTLTEEGLKSFNPPM